MMTDLCPLPPSGHMPEPLGPVRVGGANVAVWLPAKLRASRVGYDERDDDAGQAKVVARTCGRHVNALV